MLIQFPLYLTRGYFVLCAVISRQRRKEKYHKTRLCEVSTKNIEMIRKNIITLQMIVFKQFNIVWLRIPPQSGRTIPNKPILNDILREALYYKNIQIDSL